MSSRLTITVPVALAAGLVLLAAGILTACGGSGEGQDGRPGAGTPEAPGGPGFVFRNPLLEAKRGDWVVHQLADGKTRYQKVEGVDPASGVVTVREQNRDAKLDAPVTDRMVQFGREHVLRSHESAGFFVVRLFPETVRAGRRDWPCLCVEMYSPRGGQLRSWYSSDAPITGLVKQQRLDLEGQPGLVLAEIVEWAQE